MSEMNDRESFAAVDDALRTWQPASPPPTFISVTMARVRALNDKPRFQLSWLDYALTLFVMVIVGLTMLVLQWIPDNVRWDILNPVLSSLARIDAIVWTIAIVIGGVVAVVGCVLLALIFESIFWRHRSFGHGI